MNESFHKNLSLLISPKSGKESYHMKKMQIEIAVYRYNTRFDYLDKLFRNSLLFTRGNTLAQMLNDCIQNAVTERNKPSIRFQSKNSI